MKNKLTTFALLLMCAFLLMGCCTNTVKREVQTEVVAPPDALLLDVKPEAPPNMDEYVGKRYFEKEEILIDKFRTQTQNLETANSQLKSIREWKEKTLKLYKKKE